MEKILTVPQTIKQTEKVYCTGNELVSLSDIGSDGTIHTIAHLRENSPSLIEYTGEELLSLSICGKKLQAGEHGYSNTFIPQFIYENEEINVTRQIFAPDGIRGFVIKVQLTAKCAFNGELSLLLKPGSFSRTVFKPLPLSAEVRSGYDDWTDTVYIELCAGGGISALALGGKNCKKSCDGGELSLSRSIELAAGETESVSFYASLGCELDGARLANVDMRRRAASLYESTVMQYKKRRITLPDKKLEEAANLNLEFCRAFSVGRTLDTDRLALLTSKSGRYYVSGAYWARDCMLWAFPALLRADKALAREALLAAFTTYLKNGAFHALYINGVTLYPGFELDQLAAPIIALERYIKLTGDSSILTAAEACAAIKFTQEQLESRRSDETGLYSTELSPSDDPCEYPFLTYDNFLVLAALKFFEAQGLCREQRAKALEKAIWKHCVKKRAEGDVFLWACNGKGGEEIYDNPPGSLLLIPYYGGCDKSNEVWQNTLKLYFSAQNPYFTKNGALMGQGCEHAKNPWPMSLCNLLLSCGQNDEVYASLREMGMDNGIACETVWPQSGEVCTGAAFATFAGFYANALVESYES